MDYKIIDNAFTKDVFNTIRDMVFGTEFPWYYADTVANKGVEDDHFYFTHTFYNHQQPNSDFFPKLLPMLNSDVFDIKAMIRIKGNLYPRTEKMLHHENHTDTSFKHKGAIWYMNTNNGYTILKDGTKIESVENRVLLFDPGQSHNSTTCTDVKARININMNFL